MLRPKTHSNFFCMLQNNKCCVGTHIRARMEVYIFSGVRACVQEKGKGKGEGRRRWRGSRSSSPSRQPSAPSAADSSFRWSGGAL